MSGRNSGRQLVFDPPARTFVRMSLSLYETHKVPGAAPLYGRTTNATTGQRETVYLCRANSPQRRGGLLSLARPSRSLAPGERAIVYASH